MEIELKETILKLEALFRAIIPQNRSKAFPGSCIGWINDRWGSGPKQGHHWKFGQRFRSCRHSPFAFVLGAALVLQQDGTREVPVTEFYSGSGRPFKTNNCLKHKDTLALA